MFTINSNWIFQEVEKIEFYTIDGKLVFSESIKILQNSTFSKSYSIKTLFNNSKNKLYLIRLYNKNGSVQYSKLLVK